MQQQSLSHLNYVPGAVAIGAMLKNRFPLQLRLLMLYCLEKAARGKTNDFLVDKEKRDFLQSLQNKNRVVTFL